MDIEKFVRKVVEDNKDREMSHFAFGVRLLEIYEELYPRDDSLPEHFMEFLNDNSISSDRLGRLGLKKSARPYPDIE